MANDTNTHLFRPSQGQAQSARQSLDHDSEFGAALAQLKGQRLACYCQCAIETETACHGDVFANVIDALRPEDIDRGEQA